jgi:hypothetical protein
MSSLNVDTIKNRTGTAGPTIAGDTQISGGGLTLSGTLIAQSGIVTNLTVNGRLSVAGTMTTIDTEELNIKDKLVGIGSTATPTDALADGAGIQVFGTTDKTLTYNNTKGAFEFNIPLNTGIITATNITGTTITGTTVNAGTLKPTETRFENVSEKVKRVGGNTVTLNYDTSSSNIGFTTNPTGDITLEVNNIPTTSDFDDHTLTFSVFVQQSGIGQTCNVIKLNGVTKTIRWSGGTVGASSTEAYDIFNFVGINTVGSASTTVNYQVLGQSNSDFRTY